MLICAISPGHSDLKMKMKQQSHIEAPQQWICSISTAHKLSTKQTVHEAHDRLQKDEDTLERRGFYLPSLLEEHFPKLDFDFTTV